jgi:CRISPR-associated protein Csd2
MKEKRTMTTNNIYCDPHRRHDFLLVFDVEDGNPNGDPDAGNMPRIDPETMQGLVSDVCLKRKIRNYVALTKGDQPPFRIYVQDKGIYLNDLHREAHKAINFTDKSKEKSPPREVRDKARAWMCQQFYDVRMFGAVMTTGVNAGQVRGPIQFTFARSIDPIAALDVAVTRVALTDEKEAKSAEAQRSEESEEGRGSTTGTIGRKAVVPYGLYVAKGFFSAPFAQQTGVTAQDLELFWNALQNMWDLDHSAARGLMACRGIYVFTHENAYGNVPAHKLFDRLQITRKNVQAPRSFEDYTVELSKDAWPQGVSCYELLSGTIYP